MKERIEYLDFLRGIAIITVVMGHIIQYNLDGSAAMKCFNFIYSFHMGLFFFISGCVASLSYKNNTWDNFTNFLSKKSVQLLLPFFIWGGGILCLLGDISIADLPRVLFNLIRYPDQGAPWFIFQLFFIQLVYFIFCAFFSRCRSILLFHVALLFSVPLVFLLLFLKKEYLCQGFSLMNPGYLLMFILGHITQQSHFAQINNRYTRILTFIIFSLFIIIVPIFDFHSDSLIKGEGLKIITSFLFSVFAYLLIKNNYPFSFKLNMMMNKLGTHTLEIYLTHFCLISVFATPWIETDSIQCIPLFLLVLLTAIPICYLAIYLSIVLRRIPFLSILLYGKKAE